MRILACTSHIISMKASEELVCDERMSCQQALCLSKSDQLSEKSSGGSEIRSSSNSTSSIKNTARLSSGHSRCCQQDVGLEAESIRIVFLKRSMLAP